MTKTQDKKRRLYTLRALAVLTAFYFGLVVSHHDAGWFGYGRSTGATGGDPLALIVALAVGVVLVKAINRLAR